MALQNFLAFKPGFDTHHLVQISLSPEQADIPARVNSFCVDVGTLAVLQGARKAERVDHHIISGFERAATAHDFMQSIRQSHPECQVEYLALDTLN